MSLLTENIPLVMTLFFLGMFLFSVLINSILLKFSKNLGTRNIPENQIRWASSAKPALGGFSFFIIFLISFFIIGFLVDDAITPLKDIKIIGLLIATTIAFIMGLADDAFDTKPLIKLSAQISCAIIIVLSGTKISCFESEFLNYFLTILWVVGLMNSINMLDNMDGITTLVSIMILIFFISQKLIIGAAVNTMTYICLSLMAALSGFIIFNWHPSKMFMGDSGSQILGVFLSFMAIDFCWNVPTDITSSIENFTPIKNILIAITVFILPLSDTLTVFINRIVRGNSPFVGGKDHTTHHLFYKGITEKRIAILYSIIGLSATVLAGSLILKKTTEFLNYIYFLIFPILVFSALYLNTVIRKKQK